MGGGAESHRCDPKTGRALLPRGASESWLFEIAEWGQLPRRLSYFYLSATFVGPRKFDLTLVGATGLWLCHLCFLQCTAIL